MSLVRRLEALEKNTSRSASQHVLFEDNKTTIFDFPKNKVYVPCRTGIDFHVNDSNWVKGVMGPYGSGKSTMCMQHIVKSACEMPYWSSGRRKARACFVRNTSGELMSTTLQTWLTWFSSLGDFKKRHKPILTYEHMFNDGHGIVELEIIFLALDKPDDVRKVKSLELTWVYLNELSELPQNVLSHFKGRVNGRYPSKSFCPDPYWSGIIFDTNPPDEDHWIYKDFEEQSIDGYKLFHQPPGLIETSAKEPFKDSEGKYVQNLECDNHEHLSSDYYPKLAVGQSVGFIKVFCQGRYGLVESGKRVYPEFNPDLHAVESLDAIQGLPIHLGWDFGLTPACVVFQITARGQVRVLKEYTVEHMGIRNFAKAIVLPSLPIDFVYNKVGESEADPAGAAGDAIMEELSCIGELNTLGIKTNAATTNDPETRIASVRFFLNLMIDGQPGFLIDKKKCPVLYKGFVNGYQFRRMNVSGEVRYQDKPDKNKFSHPHDALQYGLLRFASQNVVKDKVEKSPVDTWNPVMRWN